MIDSPSLSALSAHGHGSAGSIFLMSVLWVFVVIAFLPIASVDAQELTAHVRPSSADASRDQELEQLKERVAALEAQQNTLLDDLAERILLGGYGALEFEAFGGSDVTFEGKLEVIISGHIHDRIRIYNEIDLGVPTGTAKAEQSYVDLLFIPWFNLRAGVVLVPFGKFNLDHFDPRRDLTDRPLVARQIVPTTWGDLGASVFGLIRLTPDLKVTYEAALINGLTNQFDPPSSGLRSVRSALGKDNNGDKAFVGRATLMLADQYEIGISGYRGASGPANGTPITGVGLDLEFKPRNTPILEDWEF